MSVRHHLSTAERLRSHFRAGLLCLGVVFSIVYLVFGGPLPFRGGYEVDAILTSANELHGGSPVRIAGVNVGKVVSVQRGPGGTARVRMRIEDAGRPVHRDATLKVRPRLFLEGNFFAELEPGSPSAPELEDGGTIGLSHTAVPVQLDQVLSALTADPRRSLRTVLEEYATALRGGGAEAVNRAFGPSEGAFKGIAKVSQEAQGLSEHDLSELISDGERVMRALDSRKRELGELVTAFNRSSAAFAADTGALSDTISGLAGTVREAGPALSDLNAALPVTRSFVNDVRPLLRRAPRTLDLAVPLVDELNRLLAPSVLPPLVRDARPALRDLAGLIPGLQDLLGKVTPVMGCLSNNALPSLKTTVDDDLHSSGQPVWRDLLDGMVGLASASQNFDGNGTAVRYLAGFAEQLVSVGQLPGASQLFQEAPVPLIGSRPRQPAEKPKFRPDVPCITQERPDLKAEAKPATVGRTVKAERLSAGQARKVLRAARRAVARQRAAARGVRP